MLGIVFACVRPRTLLLGLRLLFELREFLFLPGCQAGRGAPALDEFLQIAVVDWRARLRVKEPIVSFRLTAPRVTRAEQAHFFSSWFYPQKPLALRSAFLAAVFVRRFLPCCIALALNFFPSAARA